MQIITSWNRYFAWFAVGLVLMLALALRLPYVSLIKCSYIGDCGRDLLSAKHIAEGRASLWTSPVSAINVLPNTPFYYLELAAAYKLGGLQMISYLNLVIGILVVLVTYLIIVELTRDRVLGWFGAFSAATAPNLITASVVIWQPHWQLFFGGVTIWLTLRAVRQNNLRWHYLAALSLWPLIYQEYLALPLAAIITLWLGWSGWQIAKTQKQDFQKHGLLALLTTTWLAWLALVILLNPADGLTELKNQLTGQSFDLISQLLKLQEATTFLVDFFSDQFHYFWFWRWLLPLPVLFAIHRMNVTKNTTEKTQLTVLLSLLVPYILVLFEPGSTVAEWHFLLQEYLFFLCLILIPYFLKLSRPALVIFSLVLAGALLHQNRFQLDSRNKTKEPKFYQATQLAKFIAADLEAQHIGFTEFRMIHRTNDINSWVGPENDQDITLHAENYQTAGIQLALELLDPRFIQRVRVTPIQEWWSNYVQEPANTYYLVCSEFTPETVAQCVTTLSSNKLEIVQKNLVGAVSLGPEMTVFVYRLRVQPKDLESLSWANYRTE